MTDNIYIEGKLLREREDYQYKLVRLGVEDFVNDDRQENHFI